MIGCDSELAPGKCHGNSQSGLAQPGVAIDPRLEFGGEFRASGIAALGEGDIFAAYAIDLDRDVVIVVIDGQGGSRQRCRCKRPCLPFA